MIEPDSIQVGIDFLDHAGVKGMKWGVRNEDKPSKQEKRDAKAKKYSDKAADYQQRIDSIKSNPKSTGLGRARDNKKVRDLKEKRDQSLHDADLKSQGKLSDRQRKVAIGAGAAATLVVAYGAYTMAQSGQMHSMSVKGKAFLMGQKDMPFKKSEFLTNPDWDEEGILSNVVQHVNPDYGSFGSKQNCRRCTFAYEMRRRGYDVAATKTTNAKGQDVSGLINATNPNGMHVRSGMFGIIASTIQETVQAGKGKITETPLKDAIESGNIMGKNKIENPSSIFDVLSREPHGSRGELGVKWGIGGGHSMAYEIVKGRPVIFDNQTGQMYKDADSLQKAFAPAGGVLDAAYTRLDNLPLNDAFLTRWLKDA